MTLDAYVTLIGKNVMQVGYDEFLPSLCVVQETPSMHVMDCALSEHGEEEIAKEWAGKLISDADHLLLAYRAGARAVHVCEIRGSAVVDKVRIHVEPAVP